MFFYLNFQIQTRAIGLQIDTDKEHVTHNFEFFYTHTLLPYLQSHHYIFKPENLVNFY